MGTTFESQLQLIKYLMKKLLVILSLISYTSGNTLFSQEYQDLLILYVDENYEKCFGKALNYTENDKDQKASLALFICFDGIFWNEPRPSIQ